MRLHQFVPFFDSVQWFASCFQSNASISSLPERTWDSEHLLLAQQSSERGAKHVHPKAVVAFVDVMAWHAACLVDSFSSKQYIGGEGESARSRCKRKVVITVKKAFRLKAPEFTCTDRVRDNRTGQILSRGRVQVSKSRCGRYAYKLQTAHRASCPCSLSSYVY